MLPNGCFLILFRAAPELAGVDAAERDARIEKTKLAVAEAIAAKVLGS
ncbi:MAG: hypothetical protein H6713_36105 [Myxococcales bacterium]|nr:hypothetical protein [Myxococcales bacterium]